MVSPAICIFEADPSLEPLRGHPRFTALMATLRRQSQRFARIAPDRKGLIAGLPSVARPSAWK
jgi:hypothetical protein